MFPRVDSQTSFFPLSGESPWRVPGEKWKVRAERGGENYLSPKVICLNEGKVKPLSIESP